MNVSFMESDGSKVGEIHYPNDIRIVAEGVSFWGYTPFDRFVIPMGGKIEISSTDDAS